MVSPSQCEEGPSQPKENNKRKFTKESNTSFKVMSLNFKKRTHLLHKPDLQGVVVADSTTYPTVCLREDSADNEYAFHIMHDLNHQNILSLKLLCDNKLSKDPTSVATFVEPYDGLLWSMVAGDQFADKCDHIPSPELQNYLSQIAEGIDFLRKNNLYHGDLSWDTTLYHGSTVKLAGFKSKESVMTKEEAQWYDWTCYLAMLKYVSESALALSTSDRNYFCGDLDSLINMLQTLDRTSLSTIKDTVFEHIFFWKLPRRLKFFAHTISLKLKDARFRNELSKSAIRGKSWNVNCSPEFKGLLKRMNNYQEAQRQNSRKDKKGKATKNKNEAYDGDSLNDYVRVICGACTHWRQLQVDVDSIIRVNHPTLFSDVKNILEISEREAAASDVYVVQKDPQEPCCTATI
ncbi:hypothetical protein SEVIR_6G076500v4 [Setaria viridis]|nr:uncharacterized protein LOC117860631 isoform X2 [Setaria viridis]TKW09182.1 hypothetical protein SEVIR_6G076500v2 [Setaria viridis]